MPDDAQQAQSREQRLDDAVIAFLEAQEAGQRPQRKEWLARYPEVAAELVQYFADQDEVDRLTGPLRTALHGTPAPRGTPQPGQPNEASSPVSPSGLVTPPEGYELLQVLGQGGMGVVYKARQKNADRLVALKLIRAERLTSEGDVQRFRNEAEAAAQLDHPHIVSVYEVSARPGHFFFSMKLIEGGALNQQLNRFRDDPHGAARLLALVARAVHHAHQRGILHRDLKPSNILLDRQGQPHVSDFGLAKRIEADAGLTQTGAIVGTPQYMAPEQTHGRKGAVTTATDVYGLGAVLYALLTGQPPFPGETVLETLEQVREREPEPPRRINPKVGRDLETICLKCLHKEPQWRYESAQALAEDLERWLRGESVAARPPGWSERLWRWLRRHRSAVGVAALLAFVLTIVGVVNAWWWIQQQTEVAKRQTAAEAEAWAALQEAERWQQNERWSEALSAIRRAQGILRGVEGDADLQQQIEQRGKDLEMAQRLEEARLKGTTEQDNGEFDLDGCISAYAAAFAWYGLDVKHSDAGSTAAFIRSRSIARQLVEALDYWANLLRMRKGQKWKHLLAIARLADPDEWRNRFREAWEHGDSKAMNDLLACADVERLLPTTLINLGISYPSKPEFSSGARVAALLRRMQQRYPNDFWINTDLAVLLSKKTHPPQLEEAIRHLMIAVALRPQSSGTHTSLGDALFVKGLLDEAIAEFREAIRLKKDNPVAHSNLGNVLQSKGLLDEAIAEYSEAIRLKKDYPAAHSNLGIALGKNRQLDEAIREFREAIRLKKDYADAHNNLGVALREKGKPNEAIAEYQEAIRLKQDHADAHDNLGVALLDKGQPEEAIFEFREALRHKKDFAFAHNNLGVAFRVQGRLDEAIAEFREALRLKKDFPLARDNLRDVEQIALLNHRLRLILEGKDQPKDDAERLALAWLCQQPYKKRYADAFRFYRAAFAGKPQLAEDLNTQHRYNAACAAVLAGCGQGVDATKFDAKERARLRQQALDWLRADLKAYRQVLEKSAGKAGPEITLRMQHWLQDADFAGVRGDNALAKLPEAERSAWRKLWTDVADMLAKARGKTPTEKKTDTK